MDIEFFFSFFFTVLMFPLIMKCFFTISLLMRSKRMGKKNERKIFQFVLGVLSAVSHSSLKNIHSIIEIILL